MANTLNRHLSRLDNGERAIICFAIRTYGHIPDCHPGLLPFLKLTDVDIALRHLMGTSNHQRTIAKVLDKLGHIQDGTYQARLRLSDAKVFRRFGKHPQFGVAIPGMKYVIRRAGVSFNIGNKDYVPHLERMPAKVTLLRASKNSWLVVANQEIEKAVLWLLDHCGV